MAEKELTPEEQIAALKEQLRQQEEEATQLINELQADLEKKTTLADQVDPIISYKKKEYRLLQKFRHKNEIYGLDELKANPGIIDEILEIKGQKVIELVK